MCSHSAGLPARDHRCRRSTLLALARCASPSPQSAVTDARKRCLRLFGDSLGTCVRDEGRSRSAGAASTPSAAAMPAHTPARHITTANELLAPLAVPAPAEPVFVPQPAAPRGAAIATPTGPPHIPAPTAAAPAPAARPLLGETMDSDTLQPAVAASGAAGPQPAAIISAAAPAAAPVAAGGAVVHTEVPAHAAGMSAEELAAAWEASQPPPPAESGDEPAAGNRHSRADDSSTPPSPSKRARIVNNRQIALMRLSEKQMREGTLRPADCSGEKNCLCSACTAP